MPDEVVVPPVIQDVAPVVEAPVVEAPAPYAPSPEERRRIAQEEMMTDPDTYRRVLVPQATQQPQGQPQPEEPVYDEWIRPIAETIERRIEAKYEAKFNQFGNSMYQSVAPSVQNTVADTIAHEMKVPTEAMPYLRQSLTQLVPGALQNLSKENKQQLADLAYGQAYREGKIRPPVPQTSGEPVGGFTGSAPTSGFKYAAGAKDAAKEHAGYARMIGKKMDDPKVLAAMKDAGYMEN